MITVDNKSYDKVLFIHVPKTGGTSISQFLQKNNLDDWIRICQTRHDPYFVLQNNNNINYSTFTFSVVRNPYTRSYSYYHHFQKIYGTSLTFFEFLSYIRTRPNLNKTPWISFPQNYFLHDQYGNFSIKKIYKFENMNDLEYDFNCKLSKENIGNYTMDDYLKDYDKNCISLVKYIYYRDFEIFNYSLEFLDSIKK